MPLFVLLKVFLCILAPLTTVTFLNFPTKQQLNFRVKMEDHIFLRNFSEKSRDFAYLCDLFSKFVYSVMHASFVANIKIIFHVEFKMV